MRYVVAIFGTPKRASAAYRSLRAAGVPAEQISFISSFERTFVPAHVHEPGGLFAFPLTGVGHVVGAGPIAVALGGTGAGAAAGFAAVFAGSGPKSLMLDVVERIEDGLVSGGAVVLVTLEDDDVHRGPDVHALMMRHHAIQIVLHDDAVVGSKPANAASDLMSRESDVEAHADVAYDDAVKRIDGGTPLVEPISDDAVWVDDAAEDRYDEASWPSQVGRARDIEGFGRTLGAETSARPERESVRSGDLTAHADLALAIVSGTEADEALDAAAEISMVPLRSPSPKERRSDRRTRSDASVLDDVLRHELARETAPGQSSHDQAERASTQGTSDKQREGVEGGDDRMPSPSGS